MTHYVYRCYDAADQLLYIGVTRDVEGRLQQHTDQCNMGHRVGGYLRKHMTRHTAEPYTDRYDAEEAERMAIRDEHPLLNRQWSTSPT